MSRTARTLALAATAVAFGLLVALGAALLLPGPVVSPGPEPGRTLFQAHCATCHGGDGRGRTWRARLFLLQPGNLADPQMAGLTDQYLIEVIHHGGTSFGKPGMPSFGFALSDAQIRSLVVYLRALPSAARTP